MARSGEAIRLVNEQGFLTPQYSGANPASGPRTLVVGDVHACGDELEELLDLAAPGREDRVVFVGDLVDRGPNVRKVFDLARQCRGEVVMGNHEDKLLRWRKYNLGARNAREVQLAPHHRLTVEALRQEDWQQMEAAPRWLKIPAHDALVVHAGIRPGVALEEQDPDDLCRLQGIGRTGKRRKWGTPGSIFWASVCDYPGWVIYGHTHFRGPVRFERTMGIDTGCCFGGKLTALELPGGRLLSVPGRSNYVEKIYREFYGDRGIRRPQAT